MHAAGTILHVLVKLICKIYEPEHLCFIQMIPFRTIGEYSNIFFFSPFVFLEYILMRQDFLSFFSEHTSERFSQWLMIWFCWPGPVAANAQAEEGGPHTLAGPHTMAIAIAIMIGVAFNFTYTPCFDF